MSNFYFLEFQAKTDVALADMGAENSKTVNTQVSTLVEVMNEINTSVSQTCNQGTTQENIIEVICTLNPDIQAQIILAGFPNPCSLTGITQENTLRAEMECVQKVEIQRSITNKVVNDIKAKILQQDDAVSAFFDNLPLGQSNEDTVNTSINFQTKLMTAIRSNVAQSAHQRIFQRNYFSGTNYEVANVRQSNMQDATLRALQEVSDFVDVDNDVLNQADIAVTQKTSGPFTVLEDALLSLGDVAMYAIVAVIIIVIAGVALVGTFLLRRRSRNQAKESQLMQQLLSEDDYV